MKNEQQRFRVTSESERLKDGSSFSILLFYPCESVFIRG
jgi:hypothetical protein